MAEYIKDDNKFSMGESWAKRLPNMAYILILFLGVVVIMGQFEPITHNGTTEYILNSEVATERSNDAWTLVALLFGAIVATIATRRTQTA